MTQVYVPQRYAPIFCNINGEAQNEVHQIEIKMMSNATDVRSIMRQWAGVCQGAAQIDFTLHSNIPFMPTDVGGTGLGATGSAAAGIMLVNTMVTAISQTGGIPVNFAFGIGGISSQVPNTQLLATGFIKNANISYGVNGTPEIVYDGTVTFEFWQ